MRLPFPRKLEREKKAAFCFFFCRISIPTVLHTDPGLRGIPSWKRWTSKVSVLHSSIVKCPLDGNEGAQGWPILQKTKKLCWPSLLSFPLHVPSPLFSLLLYLLWLFDNAPPKKMFVIAACSYESGWVCTSKCVYVCSEICECMCAHEWTRQHVCVLWWYTALSHRDFVCVYASVCVHVSLSALSWHSNHLTCRVITKGCWEFLGRGITGLTTPPSRAHSFMFPFIWLPIFSPHLVRIGITAAMEVNNDAEAPELLQTQQEHFNSLLCRRGCSLFLSFHLRDINPFFRCTAFPESVYPGFWNVKLGGIREARNKGRKTGRRHIF